MLFISISGGTTCLGIHSVSMCVVDNRRSTTDTCTIFYFGATSGSVQGLLLAGSGKHRGCQGLNQGQPHEREVPYSLLAILLLPAPRHTHF